MKSRLSVVLIVLLVVLSSALPAFGEDSISDASDNIMIIKPYVATEENGVQYTVSSFTPSGTHSGDVYFSDGTIDLEGRTFTVEGDFIQSGGVVYVSNGHLNILGDYRISSESILIMQDAGDRVSVGGDFVISSSSRANSASLLTAGVLTVKGNFTQATGADDNGSNFDSNRDHKVVLAGSGVQRVHFDNPDSSHFNQLQIENLSGKVSLDKFSVIGEISSSSDTLTVQSFNSESSDMSLEVDITVTPLDGETPEIITSAVDLNGHQLNIASDVNFIGLYLSLNEGEFRVSGDLTQSDANFSIDNGLLEIAGNYHVSSGSILRMQDAGDRVTVGGDFVMSSSRANSTSFLTAGVLTVKGNFTQTTGADDNGSNFDSNSDHKVVLAGSGVQNVHFDDPGDSHFSTLFITNSSKGGVKFTTPVTVYTLFEHGQNAFTVSDSAGSEFPDYDRDNVHDHLDPYPQNAAIAYYDTDSDGARDNVDAFPEDSSESIDTDLDGTGNNADTDDDNDGIPDVWEIANDLDPLDASDASTDADADNMSNLDEYIAGSDPQSYTSNLFWGYACNVVNDPNSSTRRWGINQYNLADLPSAVAEPVYSMGQNRKIQSVACDPSGENILFSMKDSLRGDYEIFELDVAHGGITQITDNDTDDVDVTRSRDGRTIAWQMRLADNRQAIELRRLQDSGEDTVKILASASPFVQPSLSPNGQWLTFVQLRANFFAVMRYDITNNKYKEVKSIARRKKLYHPSIADDGNKVGWSERVSQRRYRVKDMTENTIVDIINDANGVEHAVLSGDGQHVIYTVNTPDHAETYLTSLEILDTNVVGETLTNPKRYLSTSWSGVTASEGFNSSQLVNKQFMSFNQSMTLQLNNNGSGTRFTIGGDDAIDFTWGLEEGVLTLTESDGSVKVIRLLAVTGNQYTVSMVSPDGSGGVSRQIDTLYRE